MKKFDVANFFILMDLFKSKLNETWEILFLVLLSIIFSSYHFD